MYFVDFSSFSNTTPLIVVKNDRNKRNNTTYKNKVQEFSNGSHEYYHYYTNFYVYAFLKHCNDTCHRHSIDKSTLLQIKRL